MEKKRFGWSKVSSKSNPRTKVNFIFSDESSRRVDDDGSTEKFSGEMLAFGSIYEHRQLLVDHRRVSGSSKGLIVSASSLLVRAPVHQIPEYLGRKKKKEEKKKEKEGEERKERMATLNRSRPWHLMASPRHVTLERLMRVSR